MSSITMDSQAIISASSPASQTKQSPSTDALAKEAIRQEIAAKIQEAAKSTPVDASPEDIQQAANDISDYLAVTSRSLNIRVDQELNRPVVTVLDKETEQVVRQIPSEEALAVARFIRSQNDSLDQVTALAGVILNERG